MGGMTLPDIEQTCIRCGAKQPPGRFAVNRRRRDNRNRVCKSCMAEASAAREADIRSVPVDERVTIRGFPVFSNGDLTIETIVARRDEHIILLGAACQRWREADDQEDRDAAREALVYRARQLLEAERRAKSCSEA